MNISQIISSRNSWGMIYTVGPEIELRVKYDTSQLTPLMVQPIVQLV